MTQKSEESLEEIIREEKPDASCKVELMERPLPEPFTEDEVVIFASDRITRQKAKAC